MRVRVDTLRGWRDMELSTALTPSLDAYEAEGSVERANMLAQKTAERFGRLLELLVENKVLSLSDAQEAADMYYTMEIIRE